MTDDEVETLARLLRKLAAEGLGVPRAPRAVFAALRGVVAQPTVEIWLPDAGGRGAWLTFRDDRHWHGWHLPGGFVGVGEDLESACARIGRAELGADVRLEAVAGHHTWEDHPYASAVSLLCRCRAPSAPTTGERFERPPTPMIREHRVLLDRAQAWADTPDEGLG